MDELIFAAEKDIEEESKEESWKVIIADDEADIHEMTQLVFNDYQFLGRPIEFLSAYTGEETYSLFKKHSDIAIVLLDVMMEDSDAGLKVVGIIRNEMKNLFTRIILRTGQPGYAPEDEVIFKYDINDYINKADTNSRKIITSVTTALRSYRDIKTIESYRATLEEKVQGKTGF
ncbi:MAG: response regulator [Nitrospinae bacterium]|nr:response regulator [Nitrospinota bacterium]